VNGYSKPNFPRSQGFPSPKRILAHRDYDVSWIQSGFRPNPDDLDIKNFEKSRNAVFFSLSSLAVQGSSLLSQTQGKISRSSQLALVLLEIVSECPMVCAAGLGRLRHMPRRLRVM
jgi:hypothetical protein